MIITHHWAATGPNRIKDYHIEYGLKQPLDAAYLNQLTLGQNPSHIDWKKLRSAFNLWKNVDLHVPTEYGTWEINHDPRDGTSDIEIGALCMGGEHVTTTGGWGAYPFTTAHAWFAAALTARVAQICGIDTTESFHADRSPYQNGPIYNVSTHAERALQTYSSAAISDHTLGYLLWSGDPDCRWDLAVLQEADKRQLATKAQTVQAARCSATWIRQQAHDIKAAGITDLWDLDKGVTP